MEYKPHRDKTAAEKYGDKHSNDGKISHNSAKLGELKTNYLPRKLRKETEKKMRKEKIAKLKKEKADGNSGHIKN